MCGCMDVWMYAYIYMGSKPLSIAFCGPSAGIMALFYLHYLLYGPTCGGNLECVLQKHMWMHARFCYQKAWMALGLFNQHIVVPTVFGQVLEVKVTWSQGTIWLQSVSKLWDNSYYIAAIYFELPSTDGERKPFRIVYIYMYGTYTYIHTYIHTYIDTYIHIYIYMFFLRAPGFPTQKKGSSISKLMRLGPQSGEPSCP